MSTHLEFYKLSGAGNDFIALTARPEQDPAELALLLCRRGLSVGADGLFILERIEDPASPEANPIRMHHWNADGGTADLCLNGTRCAARLAFELGWHHGADTVEIWTGAGVVTAERTADAVRTHVPVPSVPQNHSFDLGTGRTVRAFLCNSGVPHAVRLLSPEEWAKLDVDREGAALRSHSDLGAAGANVNFVLNTDSPLNNLEERPTPIRTYERGVEGETLACGTGAVACAAVLRALGRGNEHRFKTRGGGILTVRESHGSWSLEGDARIVLCGTIRDGALSRC